MSTTESDIIPIRSIAGYWIWFVLFGVAMIVLGVVAAADLFVATVATVYLLGSLMIVGGVFHLAHAFQVRGWSAILFWALAGLLYVAAGILTYANPFTAAASLTLVLAAVLAAAGGARIATAMQCRRQHRAWGWLALSGVLSIATAALIAFGWPGISFLVLGLLLAVDLTVQGIVSLMFGLALKQVQDTK